MKSLRHNYPMSNANELNNLNRLVGEIKILMGSISILDKSVALKDEISIATALDAINFRLTEIAQLSSQIDNFTFSIDSALAELSSSTPNLKTLHELLDGPVEALRKRALSEILTLSIQ